MTTNDLKRFIAERTTRADFAQMYDEYIDTVAIHGVPVIFEIEHLASLIGVEVGILAKMIMAPQSFYRKFTIPKASGGFREISAPLPSLQMVQRWILDNILSRTDPSESAHGFLPGRSILSNARIHLGAASLLKCDISDFFPSISFRRTMGLFGSFGYSKDIKFYLSRLCTLDNCLPQGSPASPAISNIVARTLDRRLEALANRGNLKYSRYADDLTFSGSYISIQLSDLVGTILNQEGFKLNIKKTRLIRGGGRRIVTGISVSGPEPKIPRQTKREIRQEVHLLLTNGVLTQSSKGIEADILYVDRVAGRLAFWRSIEPENTFVQRHWGIVRELQRAPFPGSHTPQD